MDTKAIWWSRTFWANIIAGFALICQALVGYEIFPVEAQAIILAFINLVLRAITGVPLRYTK